MNELRALIASQAIDAELAALIWLMAERGVPLVVAAADTEEASHVRSALSEPILAEHRSRDTVSGGVVLGRSLEEVLRRLGDPELSDETRDLGVVLIVHDGVVVAAHYVRPVERDAAGHLQRRPPAVLSARAGVMHAMDHFYWAVTDEIATRVGMTRHELEDEIDSRRRSLALDSAAGPPFARH